MEVPDFLVAAFPPSLDGLITAACRDTDDAMLMDVDAVEAGFWRPVAEEFKRKVESISDDQVRSDLELCGLLLNPNS